MQQKYQQWLADLATVLENSRGQQIKSLFELSETVSAYIKASRELTAYETQLFIETFFHQQAGQAQQQSPQRPSLWPESLWQALAVVTDQTQVAWQELAADLSHQGIYLQGEPVGMGVYCCQHCGDAQHLTHPGELLHCSQCGGQRFVRRGIPL